LSKNAGYPLETQYSWNMSNFVGNGWFMNNFLGVLYFHIWPKIGASKGPQNFIFQKNLTIWKWGSNNFEADAPRWRFHAILGGNLSRRCGNLGGFHLWKHPRAEPSGLLSKAGSLQLLHRQKQVFETCPGGCCGGVGMLPPSGA
jgi:hypothetical protein